MRASLLRRALRRLRREAWVIVITLVSLVTRLWWNLSFHPPHNFVFSDMGGYFNRADDFATQPLTFATDYLSFFPWGTHAFLGLVKLLFTTPATCQRNPPNGVALPGCWPMDASLAILGAVGVCYTTLLARRLTSAGPSGRRPRWIYIVIGLGLALYYPIISQGGFFMSEIPFFAGFSAATFYSVRLADEGKTRDAALFGLFAGLAALARPQMLMSLMFLGVFWLWRRRQLRGWTVRKLAVAAIPLGLILTFSAIRTTRHMRVFHKDELALVSTNDALNYAFGRCHPIAIEAHMKGYGSFFGPPSLGALHFSMKDRRKKNERLEREILDLTNKKIRTKDVAERAALQKRIDEAKKGQLWVPLELKPVMPSDPTCDTNKRHAERKEDLEPCINIEGKMWSREVMGKLASDCVAKTGIGRQLYYAMTHVALNYGFNRTWPDSGQPVRDTKVLGLKISSGGPVMEAWQVGFGASILPLATIACVLAFLRRRARDGLLTMHLFAMNLVGILYFGDTRLRTPYDGLMIILGLDLLARILRWTGKKTLGLLAR